MISLKGTQATNKMEYVTVFEEIVKVFSYDSNNETVRIIKCPQYPLNEFKLTCRNKTKTSRDMYSNHSLIGSVYCNLYVYGPPIPKINVKILKYDASCTSHVKCGNQESTEVTLSNSTTCTSWSFSDCGQRFLNPSEPNQYVCVIYLKLEFSVPEKPKPELIPQPIPKSKPTEEGIKRLKLFNDPAFADFEIRVGEKTFHVSKGIVAISSDILKSSISDLFEKQEKQLIIEGFDAPVIQKMLEFTYDNNVDLGEDVKFIEQLLLAANTYGVEKLKAPCEAILLTNINNTTALGYFKIAEDCNCMELKQKAVEHLRKKYPDINRNEEFIKFVKDNPTLAMEICYSFTKSK